MTEPGEPAPTELGDTRWVLVELGGEFLDAARDEERGPYLDRAFVLEGATLTLTGEEGVLARLAAETPGA